MQLTLAHLYPDLMNVYGDRGNIIALRQRCAWRGIELTVRAVSQDTRLDPSSTDIMFFGGGQDREQAAISDDVVTDKGQAIREAVEDGAVVLSVCGGYQLLGRSYVTVDGQTLPGVGVFDVETVPGARRWIGNVVVDTSLDGIARTLVGFENHSGTTRLGPGARPLGQVRVGHGNNGEDGTEGAVYRHAYGCYLHGSLLPKNPWFADHLIATALRRRYGTGVALEPLDDALELTAHQAVIARAERQRGVRSGAW